MAWTEIPEPELPETFPRIEQLVPIPPDVDRGWFGQEDPEGDRLDDVYVFRMGNGALPPFVLVVYVIPRKLIDVGVELRWPTFPELWEIGEELTLEGCILSYPSQLVGMELPDFGNGTYTMVTQTGAIGGTEAGRKLELAGGRPVGLPVQGVQA